jgi:hypothetical protein
MECSLLGDRIVVLQLVEVELNNIFCFLVATLLPSSYLLF